MDKRCETCDAPMGAWDFDIRSGADECEACEEARYQRKLASFAHRRRTRHELEASMRLPA